MRASRFEWPEADRQLWEKLQRPACPLDNDGRLAHLRPASLAMLHGGYEQWLKWLRRNEPEALFLDPIARGTMERLQRWLAALDTVRPKTRLHYFSGVVRLLSESAPEVDWSAHQALLSRLRLASGSGDPQRKAGRIFDSGRLCRLGFEYATSHEKLKPTPLEKAARYRTGVMIALLAVMPLRRITFRNLQLGTSVIVGADRILISATGDMMKRGNTWEAEVPRTVLPSLQHYLLEIRPWLMRRHHQKHDYLWVNDRGKPFEPSHLSNRIAWATKQVLGTRVSAHLFRDAAATTLARHAPASAHIIAPLLGHTSLATAERHYIQATSIDAGKLYADVLVKRLRANGR